MMKAICIFKKIQLRLFNEQKLQKSYHKQILFINYYTNLKYDK